MQIKRITDIGNDTMVIEAVDDNGNPICATGWASMNWNYLPPEAFLEDGSHDPNVPARYLTQAELLAYANSRIGSDGAVPHDIPNVLFEAPAE